MKFMLFMLPAVPGTKEERRRLRPIAANTERIQLMLQQVTEMARVADDLGFDMLAFPEHFLQTEGLEMGQPRRFMRILRPKPKTSNWGRWGSYCRDGIHCGWLAKSDGLTR